MAAAFIKGAPLVPQAEPRPSYARCIYDAVKARPDGQFIEIDRHGYEYQESYLSLLQISLTIASQLDEKYKDGGKITVVICLSRVLEYVPAAWACLFNNFNFVPWPVDAAYRDEDAFVTGLEALMLSLGNNVILTEPRVMDLLSRRPAKVNGWRCVKFEEIAAASGHEHYRPSCAGNACENEADEASEILIGTSGTTGQPKLAVLEDRIVVNRFFHSRPMDDDDVPVFCLPFHSVMGVRLLLPKSRKSVYLHPWRLISQPSSLLRLIAKHSITRLGVTSFYASLVNDSIRVNGCPHDLSSLKLLSLGAETVVPSVLAELIDNLQRYGMGDAGVVITYGMTESGPICQTSKPAPLIRQEIAQSGHVLAAGSCADGWSLRVVDDNGTTVSEGAAGRIEISCSSKLFKGYLVNQAIDTSCFSQDGWFDTGDLGRVINGELTITGREKATIVVNARKIPCEQIEAPLREIDGLYLKTVVAAAYRHSDSPTDEVAIFFVPEALDEESIASIIRQIKSIASRTNAVNIKHLIAITKSDIKRTPTGKIRRTALINSYQRGNWPNLAEKPGAGTRAVSADESSESGLGQLWMSVLDMSEPPGWQDEFFSLGGDSLAAAKLVSLVEAAFGIDLPLDKFYANPVLADMSSWLEQELDAQKSGNRKSARQLDGQGLLDNLAHISRGWMGRRLDEDGMIVGRNTSGSRPPLFWVFQAHEEFISLAELLGPEQPLYGMRSSAGLIRPRSLDLALLDPLAERYAQELVKLTAKRPFFLGGNCQGGLVALAMASKLAEQGRPPALLILMEWSFSLLTYREPVLFIYGNQGPAANWYSDMEKQGGKLRSEFPQHAVTYIPGEHYQYFTGTNAIALAASIKRNMQGHA